MSLFVDTSVWSLALRRDQPRNDPTVEILRVALIDGSTIITTGFILQELLQGFSGAKAQEALIERFKALPLLVPDRDSYIGAAMLRNHCRRNGVQLGTI